MTYLIAGLGNPGAEYKWTRHNMGFEVISKLAYDYNIEMKTRKFRALIGNGSISGAKVMLAAPQTYMNLSGESLRDIMGYFAVPAERLIVVYDDTDIALGDVRVRERGSAGGHNGMKNVIYQLDTDEFVRVRVGIGGRPERWDQKDYVLSKFAPEEREAVISGVTLAGLAVETVIKDGPAAAMNKYNKKQGTD